MTARATLLRSAASMAVSVCRIKLSIGSITFLLLPCSFIPLTGSDTFASPFLGLNPGISAPSGRGSVLCHFQHGQIAGTLSEKRMYPCRLRCRPFTSGRRSFHPYGHCRRQAYAGRSCASSERHLRNLIRYCEISAKQKSRHGPGCLIPGRCLFFNTYTYFNAYS